MYNITLYILFIHIYTYLHMYISLSLYLSIYLSIYLSVYTYVHIFHFGECLQSISSLETKFNFYYNDHNEK